MERTCKVLGPHGLSEFSSKLMRTLGVALLLCMLSMTAAAQKITVKGTVSASDGPVIGATVKVKGAQGGVITDYDGNYTIDAQSNSTLIFSYVGYETKEVKVGGKKVINVTLSEDETVLNEVVVVGYGQMKRSDLTGSVVSVGEKAFERSVSTSIDQVLQGRAAGVQIQANNGTPGGSSTIRIRGANSLNATNQPIFVIDGVIIDSSSEDDGNSNPLSGINPSDIVSMDVLKDASATAIYGSRASNGVIMITTKRGASGEGRITYDGYVGWQQMPKQLDVMNLQQYAAHHNDIAAAGIQSPSAYFLHPELLAGGTDWQKEMFSTAFMTNHNLSFSGGNQEMTYAISAGYLNQDGIALGTGFKRLTLRGNVDANIKKWLKGGISFSMSDSKQQTSGDEKESGNSFIMTSLYSQPHVAVYNTDGKFDGPDDQWMPDNPVALALVNDNYNKKQNFRANTYLEATIIKGLTFKTELSADYNFNEYYTYRPDYQFGMKKRDTREGTWTKTNSKYWSWRNILTYNHTFAEKHNLNVMLGQEMSESHWETQKSATSGYLSNTAKDINAGDIAESTGTGTQVNSSIFSYFGRAFYNYNERYLLTFTLRRDGSSKFADGNRWGWFPSAALAWRISNEKFFEPFTNTISNLKLRLGWGTTGNQNVENWAYMALLSAKSTPWGVGVLNANTANPDLKWETTYSTNIGLDISLWHNRIEFIADWYYKTTNDLLLNIDLPSFLGSAGHGAARNPWANVGSIRNTGVEFTLNTVNIDKKDFQWRSNFVLSLNRNKVKELDTSGADLFGKVTVGDDTQNVTKTVVGQPMGQFWGYKVIGRFDKPEDFYYKDANGVVNDVARPVDSEGKILPIGLKSVWIGDYIFEDVNKDGKIDTNDEQFIGNPEPKFTWGFGNTFTWKGIDLSIQFSGSYGNDIMNFTRRFTEVTGETRNQLQTVMNFAKVEKIDANGPDDFRNYHVTNTSTMQPRLYTSSYQNGNNRVSDLYIEDGSYIRLQNISLSYTFPKNLIKKLYINNLKVYCNIQNVYTWTKYDGYEPEVGSLYGNNLLNGVDYGRYPSPRIYTLGVNVTF